MARFINPHRLGGIVRQLGGDLWRGIHQTFPHLLSLSSCITEHLRFDHLHRGDASRNNGRLDEQVAWRKGSLSFLVDRRLHLLFSIRPQPCSHLLG